MFLKGLILGFSVAAPIGPIGLLCIQRTLNFGRRHGFVSGLGVACADSLYGLVAGFGLTAISAFLLGLQFRLQLGGGLFLLWLGFRTLLAKPAQTQSPSPSANSGYTKAFSSMLLLTLANPATILLFFAVFAGLGLGTGNSSGGGWAASQLVLGVFLGSAVWWLILSVLAGWLRGHLNDGRLRVFNIITGCLILLLGLWSLGQAVQAKLL